MSSGNSSSLMNSSSGGGSTLYQQSHKKITSHTISSTHQQFLSNQTIVSGKQEISLTKSQGVSSGARVSLLPSQNSLSKATGVSHLSEKQNNGLMSGVRGYLQKSQTGGSQLKNNRLQKRDSVKAPNTIDYYTVQNTRNTSIQNSSQQTSRNQNHLATQQLKNNNAVLSSADQESNGTPVMMQNRSMRSPPRSGQATKPLKQINEMPQTSMNVNTENTNNNNNTSQNLSDFTKVYSQSQVSKSNTITLNNPSAPSKSSINNRHSILTGDKSFPRATSVVKNNGLLLQKNFSQMSNFSKSQNAKKLGQIVATSTGNGLDIIASKNFAADQSTTSNTGGGLVQNSSLNQKVSHKKSMILQPPKEQYSPKLGFDYSKHSLFKSPQINTKKQEAMSYNEGGISGGGKNSSINNSSSYQNIKATNSSNNINNNGNGSGSQVPSVIISNSNSPMPQPPSSCYHQKITRTGESIGNEQNKLTQTSKAVYQNRKTSGKLNKHLTSNATVRFNNNIIQSSNLTSSYNKPPTSGINIAGNNNSNNTINLTSSQRPPLSINSNAQSGMPSCLQIDLSMLSVKAEDDPLHLRQLQKNEIVNNGGKGDNYNNTQENENTSGYGNKSSQKNSQQNLNVAASQSAQVLFYGNQNSNSNMNKSNQRKMTSVSQTKSYNYSKVFSSSPQIQKQQSNKSPKNQKSSQGTTVSNNQSRHSLVTGGKEIPSNIINNNNSKVNTSKLLEPIFQSQKSNTQKLTNKNPPSTSNSQNLSKSHQSTIKSVIPFDKKNAMSERLNSVNDTNDSAVLNSAIEIKNVIISSKAKTSQSNQQQLQRSSIVQKQSTVPSVKSNAKNALNNNSSSRKSNKNNNNNNLNESSSIGGGEGIDTARNIKKSKDQLPHKLVEDDNFSFNTQNNRSLQLNDSSNQIERYDSSPLKLSDLNEPSKIVQSKTINVKQLDNKQQKKGQYDNSSKTKANDNHENTGVNEDRGSMSVSEEQSNLRSHKSQTLLQQNISNSTLNVEDKISVVNKQLSKINSQQKIRLNLDESFDGNGKLSPTKEQFFKDYQHLLFEYEKKEIRELSQSRVYYLGVLIKDRTNEDLETSRMLQSEEEMLKSLDDEEGYYNVVLNDHLNYRYEILKVLGKGSFAQVVCCFDHKLQQQVAIKITRNTEIDHKFASSESKLLNYLMKNDPKDSYNVVRLTNEFYFRDHHCFVFELLHSDLFEHLRENGFIGFEVQKIRDYAIQILEALTFLENHQIIHCDLKPENILLCDEECRKLKLVDYGSGCFRSDQVYTYVQSRFYRAPEVILRIPYSEKVDIWSFGCILAELYTGEPLFPGNNEQEQLELIMEICGIPTEKVIDQSRKKDHYFDVDYSPFLIEDEEMGILRIPESRRLEDAVPCSDELFLDFIRKCLELDPEIRFSASQALKHPWVEEGILQHKDSHKSLQTVNRSMQSSTAHHKQESSNNLQVPSIMVRRREDQQDGVKGLIYEESPQRPIKEKPKKSLTKHFNFQTVKVGGLGETDSLISTPKNEGGISNSVISKGDDTGTSKVHEIYINFQNVGKEQIINEEELSKPHNISMINKNINTEKITVNYNSNPPPKTGGVGEKEKGSAQKAVKMIGKYEIFKADEEKQMPPAVDTNSQTSGIASEANIPPVNQHTEGNLINNENSINKITVTFYQKRANNKASQQNQTHTPTQVGGSSSVVGGQSSSQASGKSPLKNGVNSNTQRGDHSTHIKQSTLQKK